MASKSVITGWMKFFESHIILYHDKLVAERSNLLVRYRRILIMFGATALRRKREREQREKAARGLEPRVFPYIKPFGKRFDKNQLPYFKYRHAFQNMETLEVICINIFVVSISINIHS